MISASPPSTPVPVSGGEETHGTPRRHPDGCDVTAPRALLPTSAGRPTVVTPSASMWMASCLGSGATTGDRRVLAPGPGLAHADDEIGVLMGLHDDAVVLTPTKASSAAVLEVIDGAGLFHIACHGAFRADNPLFSHLHRRTVRWRSTSWRRSSAHPGR